MAFCGTRLVPVSVFVDIGGTMLLIAGKYYDQLDPA